MASEHATDYLAESGITMHSDSEQYSPGEDLSTSPPSSSSPVILYKSPTVWSLLRGAAINLILPFINGMMLGFGELFAHEAAFRTLPLPCRKHFAADDNLGFCSGALAAVGQLALHSWAAAAAPIVLGGVSSSRALSLWGFGKKTAPLEEQVAPEAGAQIVASDPVQLADPTPEVNAPAPVDAPAPPDAMAVSASDMDFSSLSDIVNGTDILNMPERLGYLHAIGLDYGWGPTSIMQWTLEHVHVWTGLGWGASLVTTALLLRAVMFYPQIQASKFGAIMQRMKEDPRAKEALTCTRKGFQDGDMEMRAKGQYINKMLKKEYGISSFGIAWSFMQIPFTFGLFRILNGMVHVPVPSMVTSGYLWFPDLTASDPYFILPAVGTGLMISAMLVNLKYTPPAQQKTAKNMMYIFGVVGFIGTTFLSAAVNLMTVAIGAGTMITAIILNNAVVRRSLGMPTAPVAPPLPKPVYEAPRAEPSGLRERLTTSLGDMKKGLSEQMTNYTGSYTGTEQEKAEKKRRDMLRKLEELRKQQEHIEFEKKYKGKQ